MVRRGTERFIREVTTLEDVAEPIRAALRDHFGAEALRLALYVPPQEYPVRRTGWLRDLAFGWRRTPPRTVAFGGDRIVIVEDHGGALEVYAVPLQDLVEMSIVTELLYCYVDLAWVTAQGPQTMRIEFNSVSLRLMERGLSWARAEIAERAALPALREYVGNVPQSVPFKFRNYLLISLLPGELISTVVFQPRIRKPNTRWPVYLTADCAYALTDAHLITVQDARRSRRKEAASYLMARNYVMRRQVLDLSLEPDGEAVWHVLKTGRTGAGPELRWLLTEPRGSALQQGIEAWLLREHAPQAQAGRRSPGLD